MSEPNAIERLRNGLRHFHARDLRPDPNLRRGERDALDAVDALYQAAKDVLPALIDGSWGRPATLRKEQMDALAAAVRRVEGQ